MFSSKAGAYPRVAPASLKGGKTTQDPDVTFTTPHYLIGPNHLECYITLDWKRFQETNTLAYWAHS
jgi:hypothetical protein